MKLLFYVLGWVLTAAILAAINNKVIGTMDVGFINLVALVYGYTAIWKTVANRISQVYKFFFERK